LPDVTFVAGDFMALDFPAERFDVVITLEVLSHVADQEAFVDKLARLLKPGGLLILATQNRPVLEKYNSIPAPQPGQLRRWVDRVELQRLLSARFRVREISSITLNANKGPMRLVAGRSAKRMIRMVSGRSVERVLARAGLGWTLMALAEKPVETA
jgi:2-polyprenyl-3-methyl-5-hydroxy-6-metoxy-1,4-benzoquinol methylase